MTVRTMVRDLPAARAQLSTEMTAQVTARACALSIGYVHPRAGLRRDRRPQRLLTKRRAVDFCRVATAPCPAPPGDHAAPPPF